MATIFPDPTNVAIKNVLRNTTRSVATWPHRRAILASAEITVGSITGAETFDIEFSGSGGSPATIDTTAAPYADLTALQTDFQSQIDAAFGVGVGFVINNDEENLGFADVDIEGGFTAISSVSETTFLTLPIANDTRDTSITTTTDFTPQAGFLGSFLGLFPIDGLSNTVTIPDGYNHLTVWLSIENSSDGYVQTALFQVGFTNGVDGLVLDGYVSELVGYSDPPINVSGFTVSTLNSDVQSFARIIGYVTPKINIVGVKTTITVPIPIPDGATGVYFVVPIYAAASGPSGGANPPIIRAVVTFGVR